MKKLVCISFFLLTNYFAKADQLAWLSKEQAEMTVQFFQEYVKNEYMLYVNYET